MLHWWDCHPKQADPFKLLLLGVVKGWAARGHAMVIVRNLDIEILIVSKNSTVNKLYSTDMLLFGFTAMLSLC